MRPNPFRAVAAAASICGVDGLRAQGVYIDKETFDLALDVVWRLGDERLAPVPVVPQERNSEDHAGMITTTEAARLADVTPRAVRKAAAGGRLDGSRDDAGRWSFAPEAIKDWRAS